jgi:AraC family transcriptional regulator, transcriptional activator of pobA
MGHSSVAAPSFGRPVVGHQVDGAPVYGFLRVAGLPPVTVSRSEGIHGPAEGWPHGAHTHDFMVLGYLERGAGRLRVDDRTWQLATGDLLVVAPGEVVTPEWSEDLAEAAVWSMSYPPDAVEQRQPRHVRLLAGAPAALPFRRWERGKSAAAAGSRGRAGGVAAPLRRSGA